MGAAGEQGAKAVRVDPVLSPMDRAVRRRPLGLPRLIVVGAGLVALSIGAAAYVRYGTARTLAMPADRVTIAQVHRGAFVDEVATQGAVAPIETVFLDTVDGGQVTEVLAEEGASVKRGQPIARLANRRLSLDLAGGESQLAQQQNGLVSLQLLAAQTDLAHQQAIDAADHQMAQLSADIGRYAALVDKGLYPRASLEAMQRDLAYQQSQKALHEKARADDRARLARQLEGARQSTARQQGAIELIRQGMDDLTVRAPIDGQLSSLGVKPGQAVGPGQRLGQIDGLGGFKLLAAVDEFYLGRLAVGQGATATIGERDVPLTVAKVYPEVRERQFKVDLVFAGQPPASLHLGQSLPLRIRLSERTDSLVVDAGPFDEAGHAASVFVVARDGRTASRRPVRLGRRNASSVEILSGLAPGERIVTSADDSLAQVQRLLITGKSKGRSPP
jgi:HlyD family secretion protein